MKSYLNKFVMPVVLGLMLMVGFSANIQPVPQSYTPDQQVQSDFQLPSVSINFVGQANAAAMSDYLENKVIDWLLRGQTFTAPATVYVALYTTCPTDSTAGTEVSGGSYARVAVTSSLANWAGTQSAGSTSASSGTGGTTSNNAAITAPTPTANWGTINCWGVLDASTSGNLLFYSALTVSKTVNNGDAAPSFAIGAATFQIDN